MNILESLLFDSLPVEPTKETEFQYGAYIMLRHNTSNAERILREFPKVYSNLFRSLACNTKPSKTKTTPGIPLAKYLERSIKMHHPMMVSTLELQHTPSGDGVISHHFVYGTHWHLNSSGNDKAFEKQLSSYCTDGLTTISDSGKNFLLQPVGVKEDQIVDRNNDASIVDFIRYMDLLDTLPALTDDSVDEPDNIIIMMNKFLHPKGMRYALHYSYSI